MSLRRRTLLAVHAHPDDETVTMGGTLARYAPEGVRTVVVTCTRGELATVFEPSLVGQDVGQLRERELAEAARTLGVARLVQLGYGDSGMAGSADNRRAGAFFAASIDEAASRLADVLREEQPEIVVTYDSSGGYGHPDHVKTHEVTLLALQVVASEVDEPRLFFVRYPLSWSRDFVRELRAVGIDAPGSAPSGSDAGPDVVEVGVADELVTHAIDVREFIGTKRAAIACHRSQWPPDHFMRRIPAGLAQRLWAYEFFSREPSSAPASERTVAERIARGELETDLFT